MKLSHRMISGLYDKYKNFLAENIKYLLLCSLVSTFIPVIRYWSIKHSIVALFVPLLISFGVQQVLLMFWKIIFPKKIAPLGKYLFLFLALLFTCVNIALYCIFRQFIDASFATLLLISNPVEIKDFFIQYGLKCFICFIIFMMVVCLLFWVMHKSGKTKKKSVKITGFVIFVNLAIVLLSSSYIVFRGFNLYITHLIYFQDLSYLLQAKKSLDYYNYNELKGKMKFQKPVISNNAPSCSNFILIIGESCTRNYCSSYGYELDTTPKLRKLVKEKSMLCFWDVISPDRVTNGVVPKILTISNNHEKDWMKLTCIINVFKQAVFHTYWISNQEFVGLYSSAFSALYNCCDKILFTRFGSVDYSCGIYDEDLLRLLEKAKIDQNKRNLVILHLMGSHSAYKSRFPSKFKVFKPGEINSQYGHEEIIADYLNSILYNDSLMDQIFNFFSESNSVGLYLSDHGEEVYSAVDFAGRRSLLTKNMVEIPFYLWGSKSFWKSNVNKYSQYLRYIHRPYVSEHLSHSIMDVAGIYSSEFDATKSIFNPAYQFQENRVVNGVNYDSELKNKSGEIRER